MTGLSADEAARRLAQEGPNELPQQRRRGWVRIAGEVAREPMVQLLLAAGLIYLVLGDRGLLPKDALALESESYYIL